MIFWLFVLAFASGCIGFALGVFVALIERMDSKPVDPKYKSGM